MKQVISLECSYLRVSRTETGVMAVEFPAFFPGNSLTEGTAKEEASAEGSGGAEGSTG